MAITFPRTTKPEEIGGLEPKAPLKSRGQSGGQQIRNITQAGWRWVETFSMLQSGDVNDEAIMTSIMEGLNRGQDFNLKHLLTPGSGLSPMGTGTSGVTVSGSQSGSSIATTGWPASTNNVVRKGDLIKFAENPYAVKIKRDANSDSNGNATLEVFPPVFNTLSDTSGVTTTDIDLTARIWSVEGMPRSTSVDFWGNITVVFEEVVT